MGELHRIKVNEDLFPHGSITEVVIGTDATDQTDLIMDATHEVTECANFSGVYAIGGLTLCNDVVGRCV